MNNDIYILAAAAVSAAIAAALALPAIIRLCQKLGYYDLPDGRKVHKMPIPRLGGLVFLPAAVVGLAVASWLNILLGGEEFSFGVSTLGMSLGAMVVYTIGVIDDRFGMKAVHKFVIQIVSAMILPLLNLIIVDLNGIFGLHEIPLWVGYVLTVVLILTIVNAINLIDGIDGLSSGLCILILLAYTVLFSREGALIIASVDAALVGALVVFWCFNMFGRVGGMKIFMGDAGSLFLGYVCAYMGIKSMMRPIAPVDCGEEQMLLAISLMLIPVLDVVRVSLQRRLTGHGMFQPDKTHIHHVLMNAGLSMHATLACILSLFLLICGINYALWQCNVLLQLILLVDTAIYGLVFAVAMLSGRN